jgi:hypothetical protein
MNKYIPSYCLSAAFTVILIFIGTGVPDANAEFLGHVYLKAKSLSMKEYNEEGDRTTRESGALLGIGYKLIPREDSSSLSCDGEFYYGVVDYDGHLEDGEPFNDSNKYIGLNLGGNMNFFLCNLYSERRSLLAITGLGIDTWVRSIGIFKPEHGFREIWTNLYGRAGLGAYVSNNIFISGGAKIPLWTSKHVGEFDIHINPNGKPGTFIETSFIFMRYSIYLFYETSRFENYGAGDAEADQYYGWQPSTKGRTIGFSFRSSFI